MSLIQVVVALWLACSALSSVNGATGQVAHDLAIQASDTAFFRYGGNQGDELRQVLHVTIAGSWEGRGVFYVNTPGQSFSIETEKAPVDGYRYVIEIPPVTDESLVSIELRTPSGKTASASTKVRPHRHWRVYVALKTHYDLGYTEPIDDMLNRTAGPMLDKVYAFCDATRHHTPGRRFTWAYPAWLIEQIRMRKDAQGKQKFDDYIGRNTIDWHSLPFTLHSYFCGLEDIARALYPAKELERRYQKRVGWAKQTDVPGHTRILPQILARSGVRLLQIGANNGVRGIEAPLVFWWEAPDGSRVLTQLTPDYGLGWDEAMLRRLELDPRYPYDAHLALYVTIDNAGPENLVEIARQAENLAHLYAFPKIQIGRVEDFADWMDLHHRDKIPVIRTELSDWWIHGIASQAQVTGQARWAREALTWSERFHSAGLAAGLLPPDAYPAAAFREGYLQSLLYSEHTWGIAGFKPEPKPEAANDLTTNPAYEAMKKSWRLKGDFARRAAEIASRTLDAVLQRITSRVASGSRGIAVFNPLAWPRTDVVRLPAGDYPNAGAFGPLDGSGPMAPVQQIGGERVFIAHNVPGVGYRVYRPVPNSKPVEVTRGRKSKLESPRYRIEIGGDGEVTAIKDKQSGLELVDSKAPFPLNQYVYEGYPQIGPARWHESKYYGVGTGKVVPRTTDWQVESGPLCDRLVVEGKLEIPNFPVQIGEIEKVVRTVTLWKPIDRIDCEVHLIGKQESAVIEAGHVAFPLAIPDFRFRMELLGAVSDPVADVDLKGNRDTFAVQRWVDVSGPKGGVTWATVEAPLISLGDIRIFSWNPDYVPSRSFIYSSVHNNGWSTNFQEFQGGDFTFRYAFRGHAGTEPDARFGWEATSPLLTRTLEPAGETRKNATTAAGFFDVSPANVVLVNAKRAEDGSGLVIRLFETAGRRVEAQVKCGFEPAGKATLVRLTEDSPEGGKPLKLEKDTIYTDIGPFEIQTIRVGYNDRRTAFLRVP